MLQVKQKFQMCFAKKNHQLLLRLALILKDDTMIFCFNFVGFAALIAALWEESWLFDYGTERNLQLHNIDR